MSTCFEFGEKATWISPGENPLMKWSRLPVAALHSTAPSCGGEKKLHTYGQVTTVFPSGVRAAYRTDPSNVRSLDRVTTSHRIAPSIEPVSNLCPSGVNATESILRCRGSKVDNRVPAARSQAIAV